MTLLTQMTQKNAVRPLSVVGRPITNTPFFRLPLTIPDPDQLPTPHARFNQAAAPRRSTISLPILSEAVAAGDGALPTLITRSVSWIRKSSTRRSVGRDGLGPHAGRRRLEVLGADLGQRAAAGP